MDEKDQIAKLKHDLEVADRVNGKLIQALKDIYEIVTGAEEDNDARYAVLERLESESSLTLD